MKVITNHINRKLYYITVLIVIFIMLFGLFVVYPRYGKIEVGYILHGSLIIILSVCLLLYPRYMTTVYRMLIIIIASMYFYTIFFLYPETWTTFIFLCCIPAISILFFDPKLFYFSLFFNTVLIILTFMFIYSTNLGYEFSYMKEDLFGNIINFIASQVIIYYIFYLSYGRMKKQELYYEQIKQSERLKTTGQLAAAVAHEIRNPLTVVKGFLQFYKNDSTFNEDTKRHHTLMIDELNVAEQVISQFLSITKPDKDLETETVNVKIVLQSVTDLLHSYGLLHDNKIELDVIEDCYIVANNIELKQLLINIIKNAIEASKVGESVHISARRVKNRVEIKVVDSGIGMTEDEIKALGTPFYSLKSKGTGLGMMICFTITEKYKGTIDFQSAKGEGTMVTISFPYLCSK